jgi:N-hydroxyarylamine O-acetyltransferase
VPSRPGPEPPGDDPLSDDAAAYLRRLGLEREPPTVDALHRIHRAQVETVPYETAWIHEGKRWSIDPREAMRRVAHDQRGGYCFHLNGALAELLNALGYRVTRHVGGVHGPDGPDAAMLTNHLVLVVHDLPTAGNPSGEWYVDAGLGDGLHEPLPLAAGTYQQGPFRFVLTQTDDGVGDWHLTHDPAGSFVGMSFRSAPVGTDAFVERHQWLSTSPESGFVRVLTAQRRSADGVDILRGCVLTRRRGQELATETVTGKEAWFEALGDVCGLPLRLPEPDRDALWASVLAGHERWLESQEP